MSPALPVPIVRRAPAAGLFGRKDKIRPGEKAATTAFPWEKLLFDGDSDSVSVIVPFPLPRS